MDYQPTAPTIVFISVFLAAYALVLFRNTVKNRIDFYDFLLLATVALVPSSFVYFPGAGVWITRLIGVEFPFLVLFGMLFVIVFAYFYRHVLKLNRQERTIVLLTQELGLLREAVRRAEARAAAENV